MKIEEAIQELTEDMELYESATIVPGDGSLAGKRILALDMARIALEKRMPSKPYMSRISLDESVFGCPSCRLQIDNIWNRAKYKPSYCPICGQALDWSDEECNAKTVHLKKRCIE